MLIVHRTGHLWRGSAMESTDSCGNCDGGRCEHCTVQYRVHGDVHDKVFRVKEDAEAWDKALANNKAALVSGQGPTQDTWVDIEFFVGEDKELYFQYWEYDRDTNTGGYVRHRCNEGAPMYEATKQRLMAGRTRYEECTRPEKGQNIDGGLCQSGCACDDEECYLLMLEGKDRPIYM